MRALSLLFLVLSLPIVALAQESSTVVGPPDAPDISVVKFNWSKERLGWERDPFAGAVESVDEMRVRTRNERRVEEAKRSGSAIEIDRARSEAKSDNEAIARRRTKSPPRYAFLYKATIRNTGAKAVKLIDWDYVFYDAGTGRETGRVQFTSEERVAPGKSKELDVFTSHPPTATISVHELVKDERKSLGERVVIMRVVYADGSAWQRP